MDAKLNNSFQEKNLPFSYLYSRDSEYFRDDAPEDLAYLFQTSEDNLSFVRCSL
ncbi:hypothetical protein HOE04_05275 [archaeon]|nr:hypothetical protein [archaeon]